MSFQSEDALWRAKSTKRAMWRDVCSNGSALNAHIRTNIWTSRVNGASRKNDWRKCAVGTAIDHELDFHCKEFSIFVDGGLVTRPRRMTFSCRDHIFRTVINDLHGLARFPREQSSVTGD